MSAPTPLTDLEIMQRLCTRADETLARADHQIDRLSAELAATKSCLAAANERIASQEVLLENVTLRFKQMDRALVAALPSIPEIDRWAASAPLILLRRLLSVEAPRPKPATGPRLVVP